MTTRTRVNPLVIWAPVSVAVLVAAFVAWIGWPAGPAQLPQGASTVDVYLISDELSEPAERGQTDGWFGGLGLPCGTDAWYVEANNTAMCAALDGPKGTVVVNTRDKQISLPDASQAALKVWATEADAGTEQHTTRVLLVQDSTAVAIVALASPATAAPVD
ncbi:MULTISPECIES: hypothetical protein [unclassified Micromonospora]|uniref:hypothetical protein n=1 Tax=unclassified Micromonospora TaxID=2617518 RepID=UPI0015925389|nr:hypothetical protein [Verrucosispora sp. NA02020]QKW13403.1 hypothetical protein HUT12_11820 [Verrucosispora sp. NA02020]